MVMGRRGSDSRRFVISSPSAARNALVVASYCFRFLKGQGFIPAEKADYVDGRLEELETELGSVTDTLRASLASGQGQHSNN